MLDESNELIPHATDRKTYLFIVVESDYTTVRGVHVKAQGSINIVLGKTPPVTAEIHVFERAIVITATTRKSRKTTFVVCPGVLNPVCCASFFQFVIGYEHAPQISD